MPQPDRLVTLWRKGGLTELAYQISILYSSGEYRLITETMAEFKRKVDEK